MHGRGFQSRCRLYWDTPNGMGGGGGGKLGRVQVWGFTGAPFLLVLHPLDGAPRPPPPSLPKAPTQLGMAKLSLV